MQRSCDRFIGQLAGASHRLFPRFPDPTTFNVWPPVELDTYAITPFDRSKFYNEWQAIHDVPALAFPYQSHPELLNCKRIMDVRARSELGVQMSVSGTRQLSNRSGVAATIFNIASEPASIRSSALVPSGRRRSVPVCLPPPSLHAWPPRPYGHRDPGRSTPVRRRCQSAPRPLGSRAPASAP